MTRAAGLNRHSAALLAAAALTCALVSGTTAAATDEVYKWTGPEGLQHYTDTPPPDGIVFEKVLRPRTVTPAAAGKQAEPTYVERDMEFKKRRLASEEAREKQAKADADTKRRAEQCGELRNRQRALSNGTRVSKTNEKGESVYLDDDQRQSELRATEKTLAAQCK